MVALNWMGTFSNAVLLSVWTWPTYVVNNPISFNTCNSTPVFYWKVADRVLNVKQTFIPKGVSLSNSQFDLNKLRKCLCRSSCFRLCWHYDTYSQERSWDVNPNEQTKITFLNFSITSTIFTWKIIPVSSTAYTLSLHDQHQHRLVF